MNDFTILVLPGSYASSVASTLALLEAASMLAPHMKLARPRWRVVSVGGSSVPLSSGMHVEATPLPKRLRADGSCWIVPGLNLASLQTLQSRLADDDMQRAAHALAAHAKRGGAGRSRPRARRCSCYRRRDCWPDAPSPPRGGWRRPCAAWNRAARWMRTAWSARTAR